MSKKIRIFTDGACSGNPGPGGFGAIILSPTGRVKELGGAAAHTTNNRMEMSAVLESLRKLSESKSLTTRELEIFTDSTYVIKGMTAWIFGWIKNDWINSSGEPVTNRDLWEAMLALVREQKFAIEWHYVRGHIGTPGNERCDEIAVAFSKGYSITLFDGAAKEYGVDLSQIPDDTAVPEASKSKAKGKSGSALYLSFVGGKLYRDKDWKSCEARVKGVAGAKFKKVTSAEEEKELLKRWGQ